MRMLLVLLFGICIRDVLGYCSGIGANPSFSGPPVVQQINATSVLVSWEGLVSRVDCVDQFLVKSGLVSAPTGFKMSEMQRSDTFFIVLTNISPELEYFYQVIAREDKGWRGVDYNRSPETLFATSLRQGNLNPVLIPTPPFKPEIEGGKETITKQPWVRETPAPVMTRREEKLGMNTEVLVWILVGCLALAIIVVGVVYNVWRRTRTGEKSIELGSDYGSDADDYDEHDEHDDHLSDQDDQKGDQSDSEKEEVEPDEKDELKSGKNS